PLGERALAPDLSRELGCPQLRVVHVSLHLARRDRRWREAAVGEALRVTGVLPRLILEPAVATTLVLDEAVAVAVAVAVDPLERAERGPAQLTHEIRVVCPAPQLGEEDQVERRRVDGAVVARKPRARRLPVTHLVHDLARLRVRPRIVGVRLQSREY